MKRSRGKGKKPLADEGKRTDDDEDDIEIEMEDPRPIHLNSRVPDAYEVLKDILAERRGNWLTGFGRNLRRNKGKGLRWGFSAAFSLVAGGLVAIVTGDPTAALAVATAAAGVPTVASTAKVRLSQLAAQRRDYPDLPEFRDDWAVACYELMRMIRGFNLRVEAITRLRRMAEETDEQAKADALTETADAMSALLWEWRPELIEIAELLGSYQKEDMHSVLTDIQTIAIIRNLNPLKDGLYDWLSLDPEVIAPGHEQEQLDRDLREIDVHQEANDALDPYEALKRERLKKGEPID